MVIKTKLDVVRLKFCDFYATVCDITDFSVSHISF